MPTARTRASRKYNDSNYDRIELKVKKGEKAKIASYADGLGLSLNAYINKLIEADMAIDK